MPFTPFHLGPALAIGLPSKKYMHTPTFILANVVLDVEPLMVLVFGLNYPLHGYLHTIALAVVVGALLSIAMFKLGGIFSPFFKTLRLETDAPLRFRAYLFAGIAGTALHVLMDALIYSDIQPFFPWASNPLLNLSVTNSDVSLACVLLGFFGFAYYLATFTYSALRKTNNKSS
jgi:hypothetical protein